MKYKGSDYSFTAKYESDISELWPTATNISDVGYYKFVGWTTSGTNNTQVSKVLKLTSDYISTSGIKTFVGSWKTNLKEYELHYMIESLTESGDNKYGSKWYSEDMTYYQRVNADANGIWYAKQLPGVTNIGKNESEEKVFFYYDRNSYELNFHNPTEEVKKYKLKYGSVIEDEYYTPKKPIGIDEDYEFMGWYTNPEGEGTPFNFINATMPENNLPLYSKWAAPTYSIGYYEKQDASGELKIIENISGGSTIVESQLTKVVPEGLNEQDFKGWYWHLGDFFVTYDFSTLINSNDFVLYPVWDDLIYTVTYDKGIGSGTVPKDDSKYFIGAAASVLPPQGLTPPTDKVFIGWKEDGSGENYYPNNKLIITGNMILIAKWGDIVPDTELTYYTNYEDGEEQSEIMKDLKNNDTHIVLENIFSSEGYEFIEWNTEADGSGDSFQPGAVIIVGNSDPIPNELHAQWENNIIITAASETRKYDATALKNDGYSITSGSLRTGHILEVVKVTGSQTETGSSTNIASGAVIRNSDGKDVTKKYNIRYVDGIVTITKKSVTIKVNDASKVYGKDDFEIKRKSKDPVIPCRPVDPVKPKDEIIIEEDEVPTGTPELNREDHVQYIQGYLDNTVRPEDLITREEVAAVFFRLLDKEYRETIRTGNNDFSDVSVDKWSRKHISTLAKGGIIKGYEDGSFRPNQYITRAELATIASKFDKSSPVKSNSFSDIEGHWANGYINSASEKGWVRGYEDGTFKPDQYITRCTTISRLNKN